MIEKSCWEILCRQDCYSVYVLLQVMWTMPVLLSRLLRCTCVITAHVDYASSAVKAATPYMCYNRSRGYASPFVKAATTYMCYYSPCGLYASSVVKAATAYMCYYSSCGLCQLLSSRLPQRICVITGHGDYASPLVKVATAYMCYYSSCGLCQFCRQGCHSVYVLLHIMCTMPALLSRLLQGICVIADHVDYASSVVKAATVHMCYASSVVKAATVCMCYCRSCGLFQLCRQGCYSVYVLHLMLFSNLVNQLDRYMLAVVTKPMAQDIHYGDIVCMKNESYPPEVFVNISCNGTDKHR